MNRIFAGLALLLLQAGCAPVREAAPFSVVASEPASIRWQRGTQVFLRKALCERAQTGAVRVTVGEKSADRQFLLESDRMLFTRGYSGQAGAAPPDLVIWASFLTIYQNAGKLPEGDRELHTPSAWIAVRKTARGLESVGIRSLDAPESLSVLFSRGR